MSLRGTKQSMAIYLLILSMKRGCVYIMTNKYYWTLYVWVTSNLLQRIHQHKSKVIEWFTKKYDLILLVYYEECPTIETAIMREKQIKWWSRKDKIKLIEAMNSQRKDLYEDILD